MLQFCNKNVTEMLQLCYNYVTEKFFNAIDVAILDIKFLSRNFIENRRNNRPSLEKGILKISDNQSKEYGVFS